jgi:outer membrane protein assembly factor BamB
MAQPHLNVEFFRCLILLFLMSILIWSCVNDVDDNGGTADRQLYSFSQGSVGFYYNPPTLVGNHIYIGTSRGFLYDVADNNYFFKLNLNLSKVWEFQLGNKEVRGGATLDKAGNIYLVVEEGRLKGDNSKSKLYLYSLDNNGAYRWSIIITSTVHFGGMSNPAIGYDNTIYAGGDRFYAYDTNGNLKWSYGNNMTIMNAPIIDLDGNIYFSAMGSIISLNQNGTERWTFSTSGEFYSSAAFSTDYSKIFVGVGDKIYCLNSISGERFWEFAPSGIIGQFRATPAVDDKNNVYIGTKADDKSIFYAVKADGSGLIWKDEIGADLYSSPALGNDRTVYVGSEVSGGSRIRFHALDMTTGNTKWSASLGADPTWSSSAISNDGTLYIASMGSGGGVYAFRTESTGLLQNAGSPRFHGGNSNTGRRE